MKVRILNKAVVIEKFLTSVIFVMQQIILHSVYFVGTCREAHMKFTVILWPYLPLNVKLLKKLFCLLRKKSLFLYWGKNPILVMYFVQSYCQKNCLSALKKRKLLQWVFCDIESALEQGSGGPVNNTWTWRNKVSMIRD